MSNFSRKHERIETHIVLFYKGLYDEKFNSSQLLDISRSGMQFTTAKDYPPNTPIEINVLVPTSYPDKLNIKGIVLHSREKMKDMLYNTGIKFTENTPEITEEINDSEENAEKASLLNHENRRYKRLKSQVIIQYIELGSGSIKTSQIVDISSGGLLFNSDIEIKEGCQIRMKMIVPTSFPNPIKLEGIIRHSRKVMDGQLYQNGMEFSKEYSEALEEVFKYITYLEKREENPGSSY